MTPLAQANQFSVNSAMSELLNKELNLDGYYHPNLGGVSRGGMDNHYPMKTRVRVNYFGKFLNSDFGQKLTIFNFLLCQNLQCSGHSSAFDNWIYSALNCQSASSLFVPI